MNLSNLLFQNPSEAKDSCIGILGGGGKTALLHALGDEFAQSYPKVTLSSLTKAGISAIHDLHFYVEFQDVENRDLLFASNPLYIMGEREHEQKLLGINEAQLHTLFEASDVTLFECDGARKRPIKAHQPFDPVIPHFATHAIIVIGADAVGAKVDAKFVHRPELFRELWNVNANTTLDITLIAKVVTSEYGYLQKVPKTAKLSYLINKADQYPEKALELARKISNGSHAPVYYGSVEQGNIQRAY